MLAVVADEHGYLNRTILIDIAYISLQRTLSLKDLKLKKWQDAQHPDMVIEQRVDERHAQPVVTATAAIVATATITATHTLLHHLTHREVPMGAEAAAAVEV